MQNAKGGQLAGGLTGFYQPCTYTIGSEGFVVSHSPQHHNTTTPLLPLGWMTSTSQFAMDLGIVKAIDFEDRLVTHPTTTLPR
jgi:hypothetical protein